VCVSFGKTGILCRIQTRVHAGEDCKSPRWRERQVFFGAKNRRIFFVGCDDLIDNLGHD
jgi:hypothetical protein